ncbi:hypothetical protein CVT26_006530 [Gymnopilus dilepis]|uniref:Uncharacterized protein n=1 Tax=Gymnopilus dilepis TaxID=231916 RepID=A0A409Y3D6_9AGAR|nr:hypothetical protein CVT26_006530 [Gymnopilus dilepis]
MSQRLVVVDDTDSSIQYTGNWFADTSGSQDNVGNYGPAYQSTLHGTKDDASLSFSFTGTKVTVLGSNNRVNNSGTLDPSWNCFVDGSAIGPTPYFQYAENNWSFCNKDSLSDGPHVITVNATVTSGHTFWFDSIQYVPSASDNLSQKSVLVDNHDSSLQFGSGWAALGGTANLTSVPNSIFTYEFTGTSLSWYGFIPTELPHEQATASYTIDGGQPTTFLLKGLPQNAGTTVYNQKFFQTPSLSDGDHKLVVTYLGSGKVTPLTLDYLIVQQGSQSSSSSSGNNGGGNGGGAAQGSNTPNTGGASGPTSTQSGNAHQTTSSGATTTSGSSGSGSSSNSGSPSSGSDSNNGSGSGSTNNNSSGGTSGSDLASGSTHSSNNTGPIVGGIVGAVALILLALLAFFLYRRRNKRLAMERTFGNMGPLSSAATHTNFVEPFQYSPVQTSPPPNMISGSSGASFGRAGPGYGTLQNNHSASQQHVPLPVNSPTSPGLSYTNTNYNSSTPTHGSMPSYTTTELQSAITPPSAASATATATSASTNLGSNNGYQVGYGGAYYASDKARREAEAVAAHTRTATDPLRPVRPGQSSQLSPQDPFSDGPTPGSRMVVHEDSGIRLPHDAEEVVEVPPMYTPG